MVGRFSSRDTCSTEFGFELCGVPLGVDSLAAPCYQACLRLCQFVQRVLRVPCLRVHMLVCVCARACTDTCAYM